MLDSLTSSKQESTGDETDFVHAWANASWDQNMKYLEQPQRRRGLKWIQTTTETRQIFKIYRSGDHSDIQIYRYTDIQIYRYTGRAIICGKCSIKRGRECHRMKYQAEH